jgi:hypothetical protein
VIVVQPETATAFDEEGASTSEAGQIGNLTPSPAPPLVADPSQQQSSATISGGGTKEGKEEIGTGGKEPRRDSATDRRESLWM